MKQLKTRQTKFWIQAALIAAIYATLTILLGSISYGPVQFRIAEALTILPALTPAGIPGLFVGCLVANILGPYGLIDMVLGGGATLIAAILSYQLRKRPILVPLPPVLVNAVVIGMMLYYVYAVPMSLLACMAAVGFGQLVTCYGIGYPLLKILGRYENIFK